MLRPVIVTGWERAAEAVGVDSTDDDLARDDLAEAVAGFGAPGLLGQLGGVAAVEAHLAVREELGRYSSEVLGKVAGT